MGKPSVRHPVCVLRSVFYIHRCYNNNNDNIVHVTRRFPVTSNDTSEGRLFPRVAVPQPPPPLLYARFRKRCNTRCSLCSCEKNTPVHGRRRRCGRTVRRARRRHLSQSMVLDTTHTVGTHACDGENCTAYTRNVMLAPVVLRRSTVRAPGFRESDLGPHGRLYVLFRDAISL